MVPRSLVLLHTSPVHVQTFGALFAELAPELDVRHVVSEPLLADARANGFTQAVRSAVQNRVLELAGDGRMVMCTCSTIGGLAEAAGAMRVDRAMAERAVALGKRIAVLAALESTLQPTCDLVSQAAHAAGRDCAIEPVFCDGAWAHFEAGATTLYLEAIRPYVIGAAPKADVIVLAQASMAGVSALCTGVAVPILSSPRLGVEAAIARCRQPG